MLVYYLSIILIALVIAGVVLAKLHISKIVGENKGLIIFIYAIFIFGVKEDKSKWVLLPLQKLTTTLIEVNPDNKEIVKIINTCII